MRGFGALFAAGVFAWIVVVFLVHNQLWGGVGVPEDGFLPVLLFDGIAAAVVVGVFWVPLAVLLWLWNRWHK